MIRRGLMLLLPPVGVAGALATNYDRQKKAACDAIQRHRLKLDFFREPTGGRVTAIMEQNVTVRSPENARERISLLWESMVGTRGEKEEPPIPVERFVQFCNALAWTPDAYDRYCLQPLEEAEAAWWFEEFEERFVEALSGEAGQTHQVRDQG